MAATAERNVYFNTRVRGLKSRLFPRGFFEEQIGRRERGVAGLVEALLDSPYRTEMAEALTRHEGADAVEDAVRRNLVATFAYLNRIAEEPCLGLIRTFTMRWDLRAVKALLRCRLRGIEGTEALAYVMPGPELPPTLLVDLARSPSMEVLVDRLSAWNPALCRPLRPLLPAFNETGDLTLLEEALDRSYFVSHAAGLATATDADSEMVRAYLQAEIDRINLRAIFQSFDGEATRPAAFLPGGCLAGSLLERMVAAGSPPAAMELLDNTRYSRLVEELFQFMQTHRFSPVERYFERFLIRMLHQFAQRDIFGIGVPMEYAWLKFNETVNLRLVARGLSGNVPEGRVREELYCP